MKSFFTKRFLILSTMLAGIIFLLGVVTAQTLPKLRSFVLLSIDKLSRDHMPLRILPASVEFNLFPLGITLNDVKILPGEKLKSIVAPSLIHEIQADFSILQIIRGEIALSSLKVEGVDVQVTVPKLPKTGGKPLEGLFKALDSVPVSKVNLKNINARILSLQLDPPNPSDSKKIDIEVTALDTTVYRSRGHLELELKAESLLLKEQKSQRALRLTPDLSVELEPKTLTVNHIEIRRGVSIARINGRLDGDTEGLVFDSGSVDGAITLDVKSTREWIVKTLDGGEVVPPMTGEVGVKLQAQKQNASSKWGAQFQLNSKEYSVEGIWLDQITASGSWDGKQVFIPTISSHSDAGNALVKNLRIGEGNFSGNSASSQAAGASAAVMAATAQDTGKAPMLMRIESLKVDVELHEFLNRMGVGPVPVWLSAEGEFPCESRLSPQFFIRCGGEFKGRNAIVQSEVKSGRTAKGAIVGIPEFVAKGEFSFDLEKFSYKADLRLPNSVGKSDGEVYYKTGFKIGYETEKLQLKDLSSLGDLKLSGSLKIKGETNGGSQAATFSMLAEGQDLWLEDFWLGQPKATVSYKTGQLKFSNLQGYYTTSRYSGDFGIDFKTNTLATQIRVPFFDARDLLKVFSRKFTLPVALTGTGQATVKANGPFALNKLSYDLKSSLFKGNVAGENFDQVHFDVKSKNGEVQSDRISWSRGDAVITMTGVGHPDGTIDTQLIGRGVKLEETNLISESGFALSGLVSFDMALKGPVLAPDATMNGTITKTSLAETTVPDSRFALKFTSKTIEGSGSFLGDLVNGDFIWPLTNDAPLSIQFKSQDWNFAPLFAAFSARGSGGVSARRDFEGRLTSSVQLKAARGGIWAASGDAQIERLSLKRGSIELGNQIPLRVEMKDGNVSFKNFEVIGDGTFIRISDQKESDSSPRKLNLNINSKIDLNILSIFTPFFEELRGLLSVSAQVKSGPEGSDFVGSAFVERAFIKFPDFPYAFENIQSDVVFNQKKFVINSVKSEFAGGQIQASGGLDLVEKKNVPVNVVGTFDRITLNIPDKIKTTGSGDFTFTGSWFPFLLKGNYLIKDGLMSKEFGETDATNANAASSAKRDQFLPRFLIEESFLPLVVDLKIDLGKGLPMKNEMIEGTALGTLRVSGNPAKASIEGQIRTSSDTKVNFRENIFDVTSAVLTFDDPTEINPKINVQARTRVDKYTVTLLAQGTPKKPELSLSSVPALPERDLISLLALGVTDQKLDTTITGQQQQSAAGLQVINAVANSLIKKATGNLPVKVKTSVGFDNTDESAQKFIIEKDISRRLLISGSQTLGKRQRTEARAQVKVTDRSSVVLSWQGKESGETVNTTDQQVNKQDKLGLDFEYKFEFK